MAKSFSKAETDTPVLESPQRVEKCANRGCSNPLDRQGRPKWCKECWAAYQREYRVLAMQEDKAEGFREGAAAMKSVLLGALLSAHPNGRLLVHEVINFINDAKLPEISQPVADSQGG